MKALLICDDYWHPGTVPEEGLKALGAGWQWDVWRDGAQFDPAALSAYPVVAFAKSNNVSAADQTKWMTDAVVNALTEYVRGGGGLLVAHSGTAGYRDVPALKALFGGLFLIHPKALPVAFTPQAGHPLTAGVEAFTAPDEHYMMDVSEGNDVFLTSASRHGVLPAGWRRAEGAGRVCTLTPGHDREVWLHPSFQRLLANVLAWCAGKGEN